MATNEEVKQDAEAMCEFWQRQLRLQDWDVTVTVPAYDPDCCAEVRHSNIYRKAEITIRNPDMHPPGAMGNPDLEFTVVHELLHMQFHGIHPVPEAEREEWERGLDRTAMTLVRMRRGEWR